MATKGLLGKSLFSEIKDKLANNAKSLRNGLLERGIYTEDELAELENKIANPNVDVRDKGIAINLQNKDLKKFLSDGRYKTQYETPMRGSRKDYNIEGRNTAESEWFGNADRFSNPEKAPIYGYFDTAADGSVSATSSGNVVGVRNYGDIKIGLKPSVNERSTMSFGDSFNNYDSYNGWSAPNTDYNIGLLGSDNNLWAGADRRAWWDKKGVNEGVPWKRIGPPAQWELEDMVAKKNLIRDRIQRKVNAIQNGEGSRISEYTDGRILSNPDYVEAQIHGGLTPSDIKYIKLDDSVEKLPSKWKKLATENDFSFIDKDGNCIWNCKE